MNTTKRQTNPAWEYFERIGETKRASCRLCGQIYSFSGSTGNLKAHLKKKHLNAYFELEQQERQNDHDEGDEKVIYEYVVADSPTTSADEAPTVTFQKIDLDQSRSSIPEKRRRLSQHAISKSKSNRLIEELTEEKIVVTKLQKELFEKELVEKNLKIMLLQEELEHKKEMYEVEKQEMQHKLDEMEHKKQINDLAKEEMVLKLEVLRVKLKGNVSNSELPE